MSERMDKPHLLHVHKEQPIGRKASLFILKEEEPKQLECKRKEDNFWTSAESENKTVELEMSHSGQAESFSTSLSETKASCSLYQ